MKEQTEIGKLKEGRYMVIEDEPCRIVGISISKPGKHGAAKSRIEAVGIFDGVKRSVVQPVSAKGLCADCRTEKRAGHYHHGKRDPDDGYEGFPDDRDPNGCG